MLAKWIIVPQQQLMNTLFLTLFFTIGLLVEEQNLDIVYKCFCPIRISMLTFNANLYYVNYQGENPILTGE